MYTQIEQNKRKTWVLVTLFSLFIMLLFFGLAMASNLEPAPVMVVGFLFSILYCLISYYAADKAVLLTHGAQEITKENGLELYRVVENLTITAGLPMPKVYVMEDPAPNAFATGRDPEHASVVFTTGLLNIMSKSELEAIAAHELSHVKNYDIRIMTITVVLVGLVVLLADIFLRATLRGSGNNNKSFPWPLLIAALLGAILSPFIAQIIKLAVSRTREYLADASGALLTRHPDALASALEKLKQYSRPMTSANHATAHLFISNPFGEENRVRKFSQRLFSTHPPIDERIAKLRGMTR
jgi:heat shock protein HtpX